MMTSDHGNDRRGQVDAEREAQHEVETDQITDAIGKAFHRLLSVEATRFSSHGGEVGRCRAPLLDNSGQKVDIRAHPANSRREGDLGWHSPNVFNYKATTEIYTLSLNDAHLSLVA